MAEFIICPAGWQTLQTQNLPAGRQVCRSQGREGSTCLPAGRFLSWGPGKNLLNLRKFFTI